jgi:hypothetical protein
MEDKSEARRYALAIFIIAVTIGFWIVAILGVSESDLVTYLAGSLVAPFTLVVQFFYRKKEGK